MTIFCRVLKEDAQKIKSKLLENKLLLEDTRAKRDEKYVYFPISKEVNYCTCTNQQSQNYNPRTKSLKQILTDMGINRNDAITSYDTVGTIAILKITPSLEKYELNIANKLLESNKNIKTVVKKTKEHHGVYRVQSVKYLAGKKTYETIAVEDGAKFKVKVGEMFFSPRLSYERERISKKIKKESNVVVFFAGVAPFPIVIGKKNPKVKKIWSIELNPKAHIEAIENVELNKLEDKIEVICEDVINFAKDNKDFADNVIMPLPKSANLFLESAWRVVKKGKRSGLITLYQFVPSKDPYSQITKELEAFAKSKNRKLNIEFKRQVRDYSPDTIQIVLDFSLDE